jgi:hypothetical protein
MLCHLEPLAGRRVDGIAQSIDLAGKFSMKKHADAESASACVACSWAKGASSRYGAVCNDAVGGGVAAASGAAGAA